MKTPRERPAARVLTAFVWHQCSPQRDLLDAADPALTTGRYHRASGPGIWYASSSENGAWAELFRHHEPGGVSPLEVIRRIGRAHVRRLRALDLTDARVREILEVSEHELTGNDLTNCQKVADYARNSGYDAILAPSAALEGQRTIAVFLSAMRKITAGRSRVGSAPARVRQPDFVARAEEAGFVKRSASATIHSATTVQARTRKASQNRAARKMEKEVLV